MSDPLMLPVAIAQLNSNAYLATAIIFAFPAMAASLGIAMLGSKFLDCAARQPEAVGMMATRMFILAGLIDGVAIISIVMGVIMMFTNPYATQVVQALS